MKNYPVKRFITVIRLLVLFFLAGQIILTTSCSQTSSSLDFQLHDEVFRIDLKGKTVNIRDQKGTFSKPVKIQKMEGMFMARIGNVREGKSWWHIQLEGYKPVDISVDIPAGKRIIKKVTLTPTFGGVYAWGEDALQPEKPMKVMMKVKMGDFTGSVVAHEGVNIHRITPGDYTIEAEAKGYNPVSYRIKVDAAKLLEVKLLFGRKPGPGSIKIVATNARNPGIPLDKELKIETAGRNARGKASEGVFLYDLAPGEYIVNGNVEGFSPGKIQVEVVEGKTVEVTLVLSPILAENEIARIILTWGDQPRDLDAYLVNMAEKVRINWEKRVMKKGYSLVAELDVDARYGKGPETITIYKGATGTYNFYAIIYHFYGIYFDISEAKVEIITKNDRKIVNIPTGSECKTRGWNVANLNISGTDVNIEIINECYKPNFIVVEKDKINPIVIF